MSSQVAVIGAAGVDTNIYLPGRDIDFSVESNFTENIDYVGQAGGYVARGYAQLGYATTYIGYLGEDFSGGMVRAAFQADGIDALYFADPAGTKRSVNFMYRDGRRKNFYDAKSSMTVAPDLTMCRGKLAGVRLCHFSIVNWARQLLPLAAEAGCLIATDLQDVADPEDAYRRDFVEHSDVLFFSAANHADPEPLMRRFMAFAGKERLVVCGMGRHGCALGHEGRIRRFAAVDTGGAIIDTNGAGDSLAVGFLSSFFLDGYTIEDAILRGQIAARHCCTIKASSATLIRRSQLDTTFQGLRQG